MEVISKETKEVVKAQVRELKAVRCDVCGKDLPTEVIAAGTHIKTRPMYFAVKTGHYDWGYESCESIEHRDICPDCIHDFVSGYLSEAYSTQYIEIETKHVWPRDVRVSDQDLRLGEYIIEEEET